MECRWLPILAVFLVFGGVPQGSPNPETLLREADRLAWLNAWPRATPLFAESERLFAARGDTRNAMYAQINQMRGRLADLPVPEVSQRLAEYLENPIVRSDDRLRLRCLVIKADIDSNIDPSLAEQSWRPALALANELGERAWANRAKGELGIIAFLKGDIGASVIQLGEALTVATSSGDMSSQVRWLTMYGQAYVQLGRAEQSLTFYDRALKVGAGTSDLFIPPMTYLGKSAAVASLGRFSEAEQIVNEALARSGPDDTLAYRAELTLQLGRIAAQRKQTARALELLAQALSFARRAGGKRTLAEIALELARNQVADRRMEDAEKSFEEGIHAARDIRDWTLLPKLLAQLADVRSSRGNYADASDLLDEASDILEPVLTKVSSPWLRTQLIGVMDEVFVARIRLEGSHGDDPRGLFGVVEQARGRSLLELLSARPVADVNKSAAFRTAEKEIAALQSRLYRATTRAERKALLDEIFLLEGVQAPSSTELFDKTRRVNRSRPVTLEAVQRALHRDEIFLEYALTEPASYCVVVTRTAARLCRLPARATVREKVQALLQKIHAGEEGRPEARTVGRILLDGVPEIGTKQRVIVSPDSDLHQLPFELIIDAAGKRLLESHVVSYIPSGAILALLRSPQVRHNPDGPVLAISASPSDEKRAQSGPASQPAQTVSRGLFDLEGGALPPLPSANAEARFVAATFQGRGTTVLLGDSATELALKRQTLNRYRVIHFAVHGSVSTDFPARSALVLRPAGTEDGFLQAREILGLQLNADLVTLSACETGSGHVYAQEGVSSLVRPFLAAGARTVVANLWKADDTFSLALAKEFYRALAAGAEKGAALRQAKLTLMRRFGPQAVPKLWSGLLMYGESARTITPARPATR